MVNDGPEMKDPPPTKKKKYIKLLSGLNHVQFNIYIALKRAFYNASNRRLEPNKE